MRRGIFLLPAILLCGGSLTAEPKKQMEIVCERGVVTEVKLYTGEALSFVAREKREGVTGLFEETPLDQVTFTVLDFDRVRQIGTAIAQGSQHRVRQEVRGVEGEPTRIRINARGACRRLLVVKRKGYVTARVILHFAYFNLDEVWHSLTQNGFDDKHYAAAFEVVLEDPDEKRTEIPLRIETLDDQGRVIDERTDVVFRGRERWPEKFRASQRVRVSTAVLETFRERVARKESAPLPAEFYATRSMRMVKGGYLRISFLTLQSTWRLPFGPPPRERPGIKQPGR